ncbi:ABC-type transport auxiliary lipoprotein family protein [Rhodoferax sp. GW822-FHT02A01]|uniref:ABC-type transport auxiliary lipoprotein family protein n=1 Tax=Rhodoferax sp. GW822-FHT02A01 TaxID=3141537 RepID=UPI00315C73D9
MSTHPKPIPTRVGILCVALLLPACSVLNPLPAAPMQTYALDRVVGTDTPVPLQQATSTVRTASAAQRVILISMPTAAPGYDSSRMVYTREAGSLESFTHSVWVDTPARMLAPLMAHALQESAAYRAVLLAPGAARADLRLDSSIVRLQQSYLQQPSQAHFSLRVTLLDNNSREVLAWHEFDIAEPASAENASGAAAATRAAVQKVMQELVLWLADY